MIATFDKCKRKFVIKNEMGLHVRPATEIASIAYQFPDTEVFLQKEDKQPVVNAKSVIAILTLADVCGTTYTVSAEGPDATFIVQMICEAAENKFRSGE